MKVESNKWGSVILVAEDKEERAFLICASKPNFKLELSLSTSGERLLLALKKLRPEKWLTATMKDALREVDRV